MKNFFIIKNIFLILILAGLSFTSLAQESTFPYSSSGNQGINTKALNNISQLIENKVENGGIMGAELLIIKNRKTVLHEAYGWKDIEDSIPMSINTIFNIRSMAKTFTGSGIQILIDKGKLGYDTKASEYIPGFNNEKSNNITIKQLLTHTSGLPVSIIKEFNEYPGLLDMANAIGEYGPQFQPGEKFQYSDAGADVLGAIIEVISNNSLYDFLSQNLFIPLGMKDTYPITIKTDLRDNRVASSYGGSPGNWTRFWTPNDKPFYPFPWGSQSFYSTPVDYAKFLVMWMNAGKFNDNRILSPGAIHNTLTPVFEFRLPVTEMKYSTGFPKYKVYHGQMSMLFCKTNISEEQQVEVVGYGGSDGTFAWVWPEEDLIILYFTQSRNFINPFPFKEFEYIVYKNLINPDWVDEGGTVSQTYEPYIGIYMTEFQGVKDSEFEILIQNEGLALKVPGQPLFELYDPDKEGSWVFKLTNLVSVTFQENDSIRIESLTLNQITQFQKKTGNQETDNSTPSGFEKYLGTYTHPSMNMTIGVVVKNEHLAIQLGEEDPAPLFHPDNASKWFFRNGENKYVSFDFNEDGRAISLNIVDMLTVPRYSSTGQEDK
ncbi:MAG: serine hydrolase [Bacteroidetes bacterium]|nr:serine hydrolase [Bacteroidota bacterium]